MDGLVAPRSNSNRFRRSEALQEITRAIKRVRKREPVPSIVIVGIDGRSGAGKSTLAAKLVAQLHEGGYAAESVEVESFIEGWHGLLAGVETVARELLCPIRTRGFAELREWDWHRDRWSGPVRVPRAGGLDVLVLTGCGAASGSCRPLLDVAVWIELDAEERRKRVTKREGDPSSWWCIWAAQEEMLNRELWPDLTVLDD